MGEKQTGTESFLESRKVVLKRRSKEEKRRIVEETLDGGASVSVVARRHDVNANQVFKWRGQYRRGELGRDGSNAGAALVPVGVIGAGGMISAVTDLIKPQARRLGDVRQELPPRCAPPKQPKMIEVDLRGGTKIRVSAEVKGSALQQVLKLIRSLA